MRKTLIHILFWCAGFLLLAHNTVPHTHDSALAQHVECGDPGQEEEDWIDWLSRLFHPDLGADHLAFFKVQKDNPISFTAFLSTQAIQLVVPLVEGLSSHITHYIERKALHPYRRCRSLRAPPTLV